MLPTLDELRDTRGKELFWVGGDEASSWTFVLAARSRGWVVSDPKPNGMGRMFVAVWSQGEDDANADGRFRR